MATLNFGTTDRKVFTPVSSALANLPNGAATIVVLVHKTTTGATDFVELTDSATTAYYHGLIQGSTSNLDDDDGFTFVASTVAAPNETTNWHLFAVDWAAGAASLERFHWRNQTTLGAWTHSPSLANNGGNRAGPGTAGWLRIGYAGDTSAATKDMAVVAIWAGTRFADSDYGSWTKTSDLYSHALGAPTFLCELNAITLADLIGGSTFSSANSTGTTLTGANPDNWTLDGVGSSSGLILPRRYVNPNRQALRGGPGALVERRIFASALAATQLEASGSSAITFTASGAATARAEAAGTSAVTFTGAGAATAKSEASGSSTVVFAATGAASARTEASGSSAITFAASAAATAKAETSGSASVVFSASGAATTTAQASGTSAVVFNATGTATVPGIVEASGTASIVFAASGAATARANATGTAAFVTTATGTATAAAQASGSSALTFNSTGAGSVTLLPQGTAPITFTPTGSATVRTAAAGSVAITFTATGAGTAGIGATPPVGVTGLVAPGVVTGRTAPSSLAGRVSPAEITGA